MNSCSASSIILQRKKLRGSTITTTFLGQMSVTVFKISNNEPVNQSTLENIYGVANLKNF